MMEIAVNMKKNIRSRADPADPKDIMEFIKKLQKANYDSLWMRLFPTIFPDDKVEEAGPPIDLDELTRRDRRGVIRILKEKLEFLTSLIQEVTGYFDEKEGGFEVNSNLRKKLESEWSFARQLVKFGNRVLLKEREKTQKELEELFEELKE